MNDPNPSTDEMHPDSKGLAGAVRGRILRLHPQADSGGLVNRLSRQGEGWDRAGILSSEIMERFRAPAEKSPTSMPLARSWVATPQANTLAPRQAAAGPAPGQHQARRESLPFADPLLLPASTGSISSGLITGQGPFVQRKATVGANKIAIDALRKKGAGRSDPLVYETDVIGKKYEKTVTNDSKNDSPPEENKSPITTATGRMTARLQDSLGSSLVRRHAGFTGLATADVRRLTTAGGTSGSPTNHSGDRGLPMLAGKGKESDFAQPGSGRASSAGAPVLRRSAKTGGNDSVGKSFPAGSPDGAIHARTDPGSVIPASGVGPLGDASPASSPLVIPVRPTGAGTIQRHTTEHHGSVRPSLATELFTRGQPALEGNSISRMPLASPVATAPSLAFESMGEGTAGSSSEVSGSVPRLLPPVATNGIVRRFSEVGDAVSPPIPRGLMSPGPGGAGALMKNTAVVLAAPGKSQRETMPVFRSAVSTEGYPGTPRRSSDSAESGAVQASMKIQPARSTLPLVQTFSGARPVSVALPGRSDARSAYSFSPGMVVQRSSEVGAPAGTFSSQASSDSTTTGAATTGRQDMQAGELSPGAAVDMDRLADEVYQIIERRLIAEKESRGL